MTTRRKSGENGDGEIRLTRRRQAPIAGYYPEPEGVPEWNPNIQQWRSLEIEYGSAVSGELRDEITELVSDYFYFDQTEKNAVLSKDALDYLLRFENQAAAFVETLLDNTADAPASSTRDVLRDYYWFNPEAPEEDNFAKLAGTVRDLIDAARAFSNDLSVGGGPKHKDRPSAWDRMIVNLSAAVARYDLPATVIKGTDKTVSETPSAFVRLVMEMQSTFPTDYRRFHLGRDGSPSYAATAAAVSRAQSAFRAYIEARDAKSPSE